VPVWGEFEFAYRFLDATDIGITGTTQDDDHRADRRILKAPPHGGRRRHVGHPSPSCRPAPPGAVVVAEVSSFQMEYGAVRRAFAVLLNLTRTTSTGTGPTRYVREAARLENQREGDLALLNGEDPAWRGS